MRCPMPDWTPSTGKLFQHQAGSMWLDNVEILARLAPQRANEIYNEFDFSHPSEPGVGPTILSYGESAPVCEGIDFQPYRRRPLESRGRFGGDLQVRNRARLDLVHIGLPAPDCARLLEPCDREPAQLRGLHPRADPHLHVHRLDGIHHEHRLGRVLPVGYGNVRDRKSTRLNSSHDQISYAVFCLK